MSLPRSAREVLDQHVTLEVECIDRLYLNVYVPRLQTVNGVVGFLRKHRGERVACSTALAKITKRFVAAMERFVRDHDIALISFEKGQRKDDVAARYLAECDFDEGVLFIGKAQEKCRVFRTQRRYNPDSGATYAWLVPSTAYVNHYYVYGVDREFGPFFLKFCSYFPYTAKLYLNGHEWVKRRLAEQGVGYEALDNGILSCEDPQALQQICDELTAETIDRMLRKWLERLPHPFEARDRAAGYRYDISIWQAEFALTQVLDRPVNGRILFEELIRENLDLGRPSQVQLIFERRVTKRTPSRFRTRVITDGVIPSLHVDYKSTRIKQYHKLGRALRTETTIHNARDFGIGKRLHNLAALRQVGFNANRRLLDVQTISHDASLSQTAFEQLERPATIAEQRVAALRFGDPRLQAVLQTLLLFVLQPAGFRNRELRRHYAALTGRDLHEVKPGAMTYQLRRLRLRGWIERIPKTHRYRMTATGIRLAWFYTRAHARLLRPSLAQALPRIPASDRGLRRCFDALEKQLGATLAQAQLAS